MPAVHAEKWKAPIPQAAALPGTRWHRASVFAGIVFVAVAALGTVLAAMAERARITYREAEAMVAATHYAQRIIVHIDRSLSATYALAAMVRLSKGQVVDFDRVAGAMLLFYRDVESLQLAPGGIVTYIMPMAGNEKAVGHNLLRDEQRNKEAILARNTGKLTLAGPFELIQGGGIAVIGRLPIFLPDQNGRFWGFSTVLMRVKGLLEGARMSELSGEGYRYELWRIHPDSGERQVFASSGDAGLQSPVVHAFEVPNSRWHLSVEPKEGWISWGWIAFEAAITLAVAALFAWLARSALED